MRVARAVDSFWIVLVAMIVLLGTGVAAARAQVDHRAQWAKSKHANRLRPTLEATADGRRGVAAAHCGRCHSEQGFLAWLPQLQQGNPGLIARPDGTPADVQYLVGLGLSRFSVRPVTCTTCHQADYSLRQAGVTPLLPAGFRAIGVGLGAQCMLCHNSRNGAIVWNQDDPRRYTAPHTSSQADVIMGKNVFFVDYGNNFISPHATFIGDSCVACHYRMSKAPHTFKADAASCARCHGPDLTMARVQGPTKTLIRELEKALQARILVSRERIRSFRVWDEKLYVFTDPVTIDPASIVSVRLLTVAGQQGVEFTLAGGRRLQTQLGELRDAAGRPTFATGDPIVRAGWNYWLVQSDGSWGVHNPRFVRQVVLNSLDALR
jgi:mono/diheme cytochrome c family protein